MRRMAPHSYKEWIQIAEIAGGIVGVRVFSVGVRVFLFPRIAGLSVMGGFWVRSKKINRNLLLSILRSDELSIGDLGKHSWEVKLRPE
jgi:hypothetical protein